MWCYSYTCTCVPPQVACNRVIGSDTGTLQAEALYSWPDSLTLTRYTLHLTLPYLTFTTTGEKVYVACSRVLSSCVFHNPEDTGIVACRRAVKRRVIDWFNCLINPVKYRPLLRSTINRDRMKCGIAPEPHDGHSRGVKWRYYT